MTPWRPEASSRAVGPSPRGGEERRARGHGGLFLLLPMAGLLAAPRGGARPRGRPPRRPACGGLHLPRVAAEEKCVRPEEEGEGGEPTLWRTKRASRRLGRTPCRPRARSAAGHPYARPPAGRASCSRLRKLAVSLDRDACSPEESTEAGQEVDPSARSIYKPWSLILFACGTTKCNDTDNLRTDETKESIDYHPTMDNIYFTSVIKNSSHHDGAIYKNKLIQEDFFEGDIADRNETLLEPMMFSKATKRCLPDAENCMYHFPRDIFQIFSVRLSRCTISNGPIQLYGYIAARDERDGMLNYVVNYSRDDPIIVHQGSLIEMTGPKRCILMGSIVLIEFDMRIKNGVQEEDDQQLIDGAISCSCYNYMAWKPIKNRITGSSGAVDVSLAVVEQAVEATIEVAISQVLSGLNLSLSSFVDVMDVYEEIKLFHGKIDQSGSLRRFVVSVSLGTTMLLKFKVGNDVQASLHGCASRLIKFQAKLHGCASRQIKLRLATISVNVTWSTI